MRSFRLGRAFGLPIELDLTVLIVLSVFAWIVGSEIASRAAVLILALGREPSAPPKARTQAAPAPTARR